MAQLAGTYGFELDVAQAGQKVDLVYDQVSSYKAETNIPYGRAVVQGTADDQCKLPNSSEDYVLGVAVFTHKEQALTGGAQYDEKDMVSVLELGRVWMDGQGEWDKNDPAYVVLSGTAGLNGTITADTSLSGASAVLGPIGRFLNSGEDELASVEVTIALRGAEGPEGPPGGA